MSREEFIELIGPYLDGELSGEERETVEGYLASSEEYRKLAAEAEELTRLAKTTGRPRSAMSAGERCSLKSAMAKRTNPSPSSAPGRAGWLPWPASRRCSSSDSSS